MNLKITQSLVVFLLLSFVLFPTSQSVAQVDAKGGFIAPVVDLGMKESGIEVTDPAPRPVAVRPRPSDKAAAFGALMIVVFDEPPLTRYMGDLPGLEATSPAALGTRKVDARSPASGAYLAYLEQQQNRHLRRFEQVLARPLEVVFRYRAGLNGLAIKMTAAEGKVIENLPGVTRVVPDAVEHLMTDAGPLWIGADTIWDGTGTGGAGTALGEGTIVGILDSGVNSAHPSFAEVGGDGYVHVNPFGSGVFVGWCDPANPDFDPTFPCNDKLIGAWDYSDAFCDANPAVCTERDGPEDSDGHGSHTASTTAGNVLDLNGDAMRDLSGVAPHANLITYDVCYIPAGGGPGTCPNSSSIAAMDQAILDGVDVVNYSISGGSSPWFDAVELMFLEGTNNGILVSASAGNSGPTAGTVAHRGPWTLTVGANTHHRDHTDGSSTGVENQLVGMSGGLLGTAPADIDGKSRTGGYGPAPIVLAANYSNGDPDPEQCLSPFPPGTWTNEIVLCDRGSIARVMKCQNVADGGAAGCVLANATGTTTALASDAHIIPSIHVDATDGDALRAWLGAGTNHMATITSSVLVTDDAQGDIMADFSSRGPNNSFDVLKPDVTNPGSSIYAAVWNGQFDEVGLPPFQGLDLFWLSGTSMSSPHSAGSGALLKSLHPTWSPMEIKSALMMTADTTVKKENGTTDADWWDMGAGRVDLTKAGRAGLVLDETYTNFLAADPFFGGSPETLNIASLKQSECVIQCTWTRTFTSPLTLTAPQGVPVSWTVSSSSSDGVTVTADPFQVEAGNDVAVEFTAEAPGASPGDPPDFAEVILTPDDGSPVLHLPVIISITEHNFPGETNIQTLEEVGSTQLTGLQYFEAITDLTAMEFGLAPATQTDVSLNQDPTNGDPYDNLTQVFWRTVNVPLGSPRIFAVTASTEAPDVDLFIGTGSVPSLATEQCRSTTPTADELCSVDDPVAGTWWILVQNWQGSMSQPDLIELTDGVWPTTDSGNMTVTGPSSVPAGEPFAVTVAWNLSGMSAPTAPLETEFWLGSFTLAKDGVSPPIQTTLVTLELTLDNIFGDGFESGDTSRWSRTFP